MSKKKEETPTIARPGIRERLLSKLAADGFGEEERDVPVVARMNKKVVATLDSLVSLGIFKSRSEAVAAIVEKTLLSQLDKFELLKKQIAKLEEIQDTAKDIALDVMKG